MIDANSVLGKRGKVAGAMQLMRMMQDAKYIYRSI